MLRDDLPIIVANGITLVLSVTILLLKISYDRRPLEVSRSRSSLANFAVPSTPLAALRPSEYSRYSCVGAPCQSRRSLAEK